MSKLKYSCIILTILSLSVSCKKGWLDAKPKQTLSIPNKLKDLQAILDNTAAFNVGPQQLYFQEVGANDYYLPSTFVQALNARDKNVYQWTATTDFYQGLPVIGFNVAYTSIFAANTVLENLNKIPQTTDNKSEWSLIKGTAHYYRAALFYSLAQLFCKPYIESTAKSDLGIILRLETNINIKSKRSTVFETYEQIISDLKEAQKYLMAPIPEFKTRPSKPAVLGMLARVYLSKQDYENALSSADSCNKNYNTVTDYNKINGALQYPFVRYNEEVIYHTEFIESGFPTINGYVDSTLYNLYSSDDLRKTLFFRKDTRLAFKGTYSGSIYLFGGIATDEIMLIKSECQARLGKIEESMKTLNSLLEKRWKTNTFIAYVATNKEDALKKIITERRKELCFRGVRWTDLRRLNQDPTYAITLTRGLLGSTTTFTLPPNDNRYIYPIPDTEILYSGVEQNPR